MSVDPTLSEPRYSSAWILAARSPGESLPAVSAGPRTVDDPEVSSSVDIERISCRSAESSAVIESWKGCNTDDMMVQKIY